MDAFLRWRLTRSRSIEPSHLHRLGCSPMVRFSPLSATEKYQKCSYSFDVAMGKSRVLIVEIAQTLCTLYQLDVKVIRELMWGKPKHITPEEAGLHSDCSRDTAKHSHSTSME